MTTKEAPKKDWAKIIADGQRRVRLLQADLANGVDEVESARKHGFGTRDDLNRMLAPHGVQTDGTTSWSTKS